MASKKKETIADVIKRRRERLISRSDTVRLIFRMILIAAAVYLIFTEVFLLRQISGMDMFPAIKDGDLAIVFRLQQDYHKNDVIAYETADGTHFGRIIAREGDIVTIDESGDLVVNGTLQSGEILFPTFASSEIEYPYRVPKNSVFVLGDYRTNAEDSRNFGAIPMEDVYGKVITILRRRGL